MLYAVLFNLEIFHSEFSVPLLIMLFVPCLNQLCYEEKNWWVRLPVAERIDAEQTEELFHMACGLCVFTMKPVLHTAFGKNSEGGRQTNNGIDWETKLQIWHT